MISGVAGSDQLDGGAAGLGDGRGRAGRDNADGDLLLPLPGLSVTVLLTTALQVPVGVVATGTTATITQTGGTPVQLSEPATPLITFTSPATAAAGQQVTVTGSGFGATRGEQLPDLQRQRHQLGRAPRRGRLRRRQLERQRRHVYRSHARAAPTDSGP